MISENKVSSSNGPRSFGTFIKRFIIHQNFDFLNPTVIGGFFNFNRIVSKLISSYQKKICYLDRQQWERSLEDHILSRADHILSQDQKSFGTILSRSNPAVSPLTNDLIDLDLISGSAYTMKSKSQQGWISMLLQAILRVLFFPLYLKWWSEKTSGHLVGLLFMLYILQIVSIRIYYQKNFVASFSSDMELSYNNNTNGTSYSSKTSQNEFSGISATEILMPIAMMIVLGIIHTQMVGTKNLNKISSSNNSVILHSSKKSMQNYSNDEILCDQIQHTDCSSSSVSSTSSSIDSSPISGLRHRIQNSNRLEKYNNHFEKQNQKVSTMHIPKIKFYNEFENQNDEVLLINNNQKSEIFDDCNNNKWCIKKNSVSSKLLSKVKRKSKLRMNLKLSNISSSWNYEDDNLNSSPISIRSSLYGSSFDSEGTISPMTPILLQSDEWPTIHSDATSDIEDDDNLGNYYSYEKRSQISINENNGRQSPSFRQNDKKMNSENKIQYQNECKHHRYKKETNENENTSTPSNELKVSCSFWKHNVCQKLDLSVGDISSAIIRKVETVEHSTEYIYLGIIFSLTLALIPPIYRIQFKEGPSIVNILNSSTNLSSPSSSLSSSSSTSNMGHLSDLQSLLTFFFEEAFFANRNSRIRIVVIIAMLERFVLSLLYFFLLCVTERTFKQRFLYSKYFSYITRRDRAKRSQIPHFRLHKVRNLKVWLSVRSYLRKYGPHRSVDTICSTTFIISICLLTCISLQILKDSNESCTSRLICWEMIFWSLALGIYIMRLMILGSRINQKYRSNLSVLITEQINLYLQLERKPHKKDALMLANQVLKLAVDLLKELESPYKISGFSANPYLYNITKVVVLSAFSAVLTEMLGFKLKLYKIKLIR